MSAASLLRMAVKEREKRQRLMAMKEDAEADLLCFIRMMWPVLEPERPLVEGWLLDLLVDVLMSISDGELVRVCINVPPGSTKSTLLNVLWPAWEWGPRNRPSLRYLSVSYSTAVPVRDNLRFTRLIKHPVYQACWGDRVKLVRDGAEWVGNDRTGFKMVTSTGGGTTGFRGDRILCLPHSSRILTDAGWLQIGDIVREKRNVRVTGWSGTGTEWQQIEAFETNPGGRIVAVDFGSGVLRCTPDHPVWVEGRGYIAAGQINPGDTLVGTKEAGFDTPVRTVRDDPVLSISRASQTCEMECVQPPMRSLAPHGRREPGLPNGEAADHVRMVRDGETLRCERSQSSQNLFGVMPVQDAVGEQREDARDQDMRGMREGISPRIPPASVLLSAVQGCVACPEDDGRRQWHVRAWGGEYGVSARMDTNLQGFHSRPGREHLFAMWPNPRSERQEALCPPYRLHQRELGANEPDISLSILPWDDAWESRGTIPLEGRVVRSVEFLGDEPVTYNLRVGPHHNYFADGILTHNCDDLNNPIDVESDTVRATTNKFLREVLPDRLNSLATSAIINLQQRTHREDATGTLIEFGQGYEFVCVPMEFDPLRICKVTLERDINGKPKRMWVDPRSMDENGRQLKGLVRNSRGEPHVIMGSPMAQATGESCWPERFDEESVAKLKLEKGAYAWDSQYQQIPGVRGGAVIMRDWWKLWPSDDYPTLGTVVVSVDTAIEEKETNDWNACTAWGVFAGKQGEPLFLLLAAWKIRTNLANLVRLIAETCKERRADYLLVERKTRGKDVSDEIKRLYANATWDTVLVVPDGDKISRLKAISHLFSGDVVRRDPTDKRAEDTEFAPEPDGKTRADMMVYRGGVVYAPDKEWADEVITQVADFPYSAHDDYCDTVSQALGWCRKHGVVLRKTEFEDDEFERNKFRRPVGIPYHL